MDIGSLLQVHNGLIPANHIKFPVFSATFYRIGLKNLGSGIFKSKWFDIHIYLIDQKTVSKREK